MLQNRIKVFSETEMEQIHQGALLLLAKKGILFQGDDAVDLFSRHGAAVSDHTVFLSEEMVEAALFQCPSSFLLEAPEKGRSVMVGEGLLIHPAGGEIFIADPDGKRRSPVLADYAAIQKVYQYCDEIDIGGSKPLNPVDKDDRVKGLYLTLAAMRHCNKPILTPVEEMDERQLDCLKLYQILYGDDDIFEKHYVTWHPVCSASPYCYPVHATDGIRLFAERNQPVVLVSAPMSGITSPVHLFSTVVLAVAELLAGIVYAQLIRAGVPVVPSASLTYGNMRYATWECAAPDTALLLGGMTQLFRDYYKLPARAQTGVTSAKAVDYQAGLETMQSFLFTALCGVNLTSQSVGSLANLLTLSPEKTVIDNEMISRVRYMLRGMATDEGAFDLDDMLKTAAGGDFMTAPSTVAHFRDGWQPSVSDWHSYDAWAADGGKKIQDTATEKVQEILAKAPETLLDPAQEKLMTDYIRHIEKKHNLI